MVGRFFFRIPLKMGNFEVPAVRFPVYENCVGGFIQIIVLFVHPEKSPGEMIQI